jgi:hypothetical protein
MTLAVCALAAPSGTLWGSVAYFPFAAWATPTPKPGARTLSTRLETTPASAAAPTPHPGLTPKPAPW